MKTELEIYKIALKKLKIELCIHKDTGAIGKIKNRLDATDKFPDQYGIFWLYGANYGEFANHPYWNDQDKIKLIL